MFCLKSKPSLPWPGRAERAAETGDTGDRDGRTGAGIAVADGLLVPMRVLQTELVQLARAQRRDELTGDRVHRVEEVGRLLERGVQVAAAAVVGRVVGEPDPAHGRAVGLAQLQVGLSR